MFELTEDQIQTTDYIAREYFIYRKMTYRIKVFETVVMVERQSNSVSQGASNRPMDIEPIAIWRGAGIVEAIPALLDEYERDIISTD